MDCGLPAFVHHFRDPSFNDLFFPSVLVFPRSDLVERNAMLRTKAMREKEEQRERRKYNYTLLRIRLPDGNLLQGNHRSLNQHNTHGSATERKWARNVWFQGPFMHGTGCLCCLGLFGSPWWTAGSPLSSSPPEARNYKSLKKSLWQSVTWWVLMWI